MKVALAAQTLSNSVADSVEFCTKNLELPEFQGSEGTVRFIRSIDRVFDFLNSRNPFDKGFKSPLRRTNESYWRSNILAEVNYLKGITDLKNKPMYLSRRYVPFVGLIIAIMSIEGIFDKYVMPENSQIKYLLTYKFSQDHLELFLCAIRSCGGWCPNPTCAQFVSAYKRLLIHHEIVATNGNVKVMDATKILTVPKVSQKLLDIYDAMENQRIVKKYGVENDDTNDERNSIEFLQEFLTFYIDLPEVLTKFSKNCVTHISGCKKID